MASSMKRKAAANVPDTKVSTKRMKVAAAARPEKAGGEIETRKKGKVEAQPQLKTNPPSDAPLALLAKEQPAFPRGGAGILTPLERKQIQVKASQDALAEHSGTKDLFGSSYAVDPTSDDENLERNGSKARKKVKNRSKRSEASRSTRPGSFSQKETIRIEGLKHKHLTPGTLVLGQVLRIGASGLTLALPNNLVGHVSITAVSRQVNDKIKILLADDKNTDDVPSGDEQSDVDLHIYFRIGQYLRAVVVPSEETLAAGKGRLKKRVELSVQPDLVNVRLTRSDLMIGATLQVSISSVEDHGVIVDPGLDGNAIKGFIPMKEFEDSNQIEHLQTGAVILCVITDVGSNGRTVKVSTDPLKLAATSKAIFLKDAPSVECFLPGTSVEVLISDVTASGLKGNVMGILDASADVVHSGAYNTSDDLREKYTVGKRLKARVIFSHTDSESKRIGFSLLPRLLSFQADPATNNDEQGPISLSQVVSNAEVVRVEPGLGVYFRLRDGITAFAHVSRLSDQKLETMSETSGPFQLGSKHKLRVLDYNSIDSLYLVSLQDSVLSKPFLRIEDVQVAQLVKGSIQKVLIGERGVKGVIVNLTEEIDGLVPENHLSDVVLKHPEKKFREGLSVSARVLSTDLTKRQIRLTLKKSLVNSDQKVWQDYFDIAPGDSTPGTLVKIDPHGALLQFYGDVKGYLPVSEMSEAYIKDATEHFRIGQVVTVSAVSIDPEIPKLIVSCRDLSSGNVSVESALASLKPGTLVGGTVFEKSENDLLLRLDESNLIARLPIDHVSDGTLKKRQSALSRFRVGQKLSEVVLLDVLTKRRLVVVSNRQSLINAVKAGTLLRSFEDLREGQTLTGLISNITPDGIYLAFAGGISGLIPKTGILDENLSSVDYGAAKLQPVTATVSSIDYKGAVPRFWLSMKEYRPSGSEDAKKAPSSAMVSDQHITNAVDSDLNQLEDLRVGKVLRVRVTSVKETQLNVEIAQDIQGRIDVSEAFDSWDDIKDRKRPMFKFSVGEVLPAKILGAHDARNHKFLPISHRSGKTSMLELTAKRSIIDSPQSTPLTLKDIHPGSSWLAFVNNVMNDCLWVNISPNVRGRIRAIDVSDDLSVAGNLEANYPIGSALRVQVIAADLDQNRLDLSARLGSSGGPLTFKDISKGAIVPGRITRVSDRNLLVQLSDSLVGAVDLIDMADDYALSNPARFTKNEILRVYVAGIDIPNKKISLSLRPSKVMSSSLPVEDPEITSIDQLEVNKIYRGFISNVADKGVFVILGHGITGFVRVTNLSDGYLKEWKEHFQRDQLVKGKIISIDKQSGYVQMSLRESVMKPGYKAPKQFSDMKVGDIVTAKVAKVEKFGVFILVDNSENVRGLCHRSEIAESRIEDVSSLFSEGDTVTAKVLKVDLSQRRINFGMKTSYFPDAAQNDEDSEVDSDGGALVDQESAPGDNIPEDLINVYDHVDSLDAENSLEPLPDDEDAGPMENTAKTHSIFGGVPFDLNPGSQPGAVKTSLKRTSYASDTDDERTAGIAPMKKRKRADVQVDHTGDLDSHGPQSSDDYERLLLSDPDSSVLWLRYMASYLEQGDIEQARTIGERALKSIGVAQDAEKLNVWVALLNLENAYGDDDGQSVRTTLERALEYNDPKEMYGKLASIYISSGKLERADQLFKEMTRSQKLGASDPKVWINYATFLYDKILDADKARGLLPQMLKSVPKWQHIDLTSKLAQLEFRCKTGVPERGRTIFEGLLASFPKKIDLWSVLLDLEMTLLPRDGEEGEAVAQQVRAVFERIFTTGRQLKAKQAKYFFKRWLAFEEQYGDDRRSDEVKRRAAEYVKEVGSSET